MTDTEKTMAIETSGRLGSVALACGREILAEYRFTSHQRHAADLLPTIDELCRKVGWQPQDLQTVFVSAGPGSFTGIRIAVTVGKALAFAIGAKLIAVPSMDVRALNIHDACREQDLDIPQFAVIEDARRLSIYAAGYRRFEESEAKSNSTARIIPGLQCFHEPRMIKPEELRDQWSRPLYLLGDGLKCYADILTGPDLIWLDETYWQPWAHNVLQCGWPLAQAGQFVTAEELSPIYLQRPSAVDRWEQRHLQQSSSPPSEAAE